MAETLINKTDFIKRTTHRVNEHELLQRLECLCETAGVEFPKEAWPKDDRKAYFLLGVCATEDMKDLSLRERLERLDDWARQRSLLKPNETLFAKHGVRLDNKDFQVTLRSNHRPRKTVDCGTPASRLRASVAQIR
jgi:hypothetical protein